MTPFRDMVIDALEEMGVRATSRNVMVLLRLLKDVLSVVESRARVEGIKTKGEEL